MARSDEERAMHGHDHDDVAEEAFCDAIKAIGRLAYSSKKMCEFNHAVCNLCAHMIADYSSEARERLLTKINETATEIEAEKLAQRAH